MAKETVKIAKNYKELSWLELFTSNYNGETKEAQELLEVVKPNYKNDIYIPWAILEKMMYLQDENATIEIIEKDNSIISTYKDTVYTKQVQNDSVVNETTTSMLAHFIHLKGTFKGHTLEEIFPIQDNGYNAVKFYNQNDVNKAIQRGRTRLIARLTGLGLSLYEKGDLQYEEKTDTNTKVENLKDKYQQEEKQQKTTEKETKTTEKETKVEEPIKTTEIKETPKKEVKEEPKEDVKQEIEEDRVVKIKEMISILKSDNKYKAILTTINNALSKKYNYTLDLEKDTEEELINKINNINNLDNLYRAIKEF